MKQHTPISKRLRSYSTAAVGTTAVLAGQAEAATVLTPGSSNFTSTLQGITGVITVAGSGGSYNTTSLNFSSNVQLDKGNFKRSTNTGSINLQPSTNNVSFGYSLYGGTFISRSNSLLNSSDNWLYARNVADQTKSGWLQIAFGNGSVAGSFSVVKLVANSSAGEIPSAAAAAAAVPEPSALALLSLGATGIVLRRRRQAA